MQNKQHRILRGRCQQDARVKLRGSATPKKGYLKGGSRRLTQALSGVSAPVGLLWACGRQNRELTGAGIHARQVLVKGTDVLSCFAGTSHAGRTHGKRSAGHKPAHPRKWVRGGREEAGSKFQAFPTGFSRVGGIRRWGSSDRKGMKCPGEKYTSITSMRSS